MTDIFTPDRRASDSTQEDIRSLILSVPDQGNKAMLLVLLRMAGNLEENTAIMQALSKKVESQAELFGNHENNERVLLGKASMAWYLLSGVIVFAMGIAGIWFNSVAEDYKTLGATVADHTVQITAHRKDIDLLQQLSRIQDGIKKEMQ